MTAPNKNSLTSIRASCFECSVSTAATHNNFENAESFDEFIKNNKDNMFVQSLSEYLMELLNEKGLKRADVIKKSGLDEAYVYEIFGGKKIPPVTSLSR